ncbi:FG-GAP-like repeat-containing protein [Bdellovibrio sp. KM01]|uniref:FG-GAP-like repeat-containing protein n=1 Tax=Bdellovibrio sp. KM01 TaxID=2748865 RepID=UPI0015EABC60|nr:FG-GAP-like repeat-containing protein [Bdellovibrio sp. KM01]QLY24807.1 FG-GAP repeat protein [Bdellovibrio sp. KM01]
MRHFLSCSSLIIFGFILASCNNAGLQGTSIPSKFEGVQEAVAISPTAVKLSWSLQARFKEYRVYRKGFSAPDKVETFATTTISPLAVDTFYDFSVTGVSATDGAEIGYDKSLSVKTMSTFGGVPASGLTAQTNGSVEVSWVKNGDGVTYKIYTKKESETWDLTNPAATIINKSVGSVTNLPSGNKYCFWVMAYYQDGTFEPANMSEAYINSKAPCVLVQSQLANLPTVKMQMATVGNFPWFWTEGGDSTYTTEIFERATDIRWAIVNGNDYFRSIVPISPGQKDMYAKVTSATGASTIVSVLIEGSGKIKKPLIRSLEGVSAPVPLYPRLVNGGLGMQELGSQVAVGDFNCDGLMDVAVSAPKATAYVGDKHEDSTGAVVVYYGYDAPPYYDAQGNLIDPGPTLKTSPTPSADAAYPDPQLVFYPGLPTGTRLGQALAVGNINGDCFSRYTDLSDSKANKVGLCDNLFTPASGISDISKVKKIYRCDDLAMMTSQGQVFVAFGDPTRGLVTGSGGISYGVNETTCDPTSFKCRPVKIYDDTTVATTSISFGDFNNDGFDDLAIGVTTYVAPNYKRQVAVLRGDRMGLFPVTSTKSFPVIDAESIGLSSLIAADGTFAGKSYTEDFAKALGTAYNSRVCENNATYTFRQTNYAGETSPAPKNKGYDFTKCDDLVIGVPGRSSGRGSILACKGVMPTIASGAADLQKISSWTCQESYPDLSSNSEANYITVQGYGSSILGVPNQNGYPLTNIIGTTNNVPNLNGAVFVGAPTSTVSGMTNAGVVFGYYVTPRSNDYATGGIMGILDPLQSITAINRVACDSRNTNVTTGSLKHCENQVIHTNPPESYVQFGYSMGTVADIETISRAMPSLAISAPYRSTTSSTGNTTIAASGVIYLYKPDVSTLGYEGATRIDTPRLSDNDNTACASNCTWYSGGVNPFGASVIYPRDLTANSNFGLGGAAGADFNGDGSGDLIVGAPYLSSPVYYNGGAFIFNSTGNFASSVTKADQTIDVNFSKELNYHYERAKVAGDFNGDGYMDVVTQISVGNTVEVVIYYGSASGLVLTPDPSRNPATDLAPLKLVVDLDPGLGGEFYRIGSVNGDAYDDLMVIGNKASYIYYGSSSGLVANSTPSVSPVGQNPMSFALADTNSVYFHYSGATKRTAANIVPSELGFSDFTPKNRAVTYGDFNGDGFGDFTVATDSADLPSTDVRVGSLLYTTANYGRVFVFYGSKDGPQTNRTNGKTLLSDSNGYAADIVVENPCTVTVPAVCKVQMLLSNEAAGGVRFGWSAATIKSLETQSGEIYDELVVSDPGYSTYTGRAYLYKGTNRGLAYTPVQKLQGSTTGEGFGYSVIAPGDINKDGVSDLVVSAPRTPSVSVNATVYTFFGGAVGTVMAFKGATDINSTTYFGAGALAINTVNAGNMDLKPQRSSPTLFQGSTTDHFGAGIAAVGDINADGYADIIVNVPGRNYDLDTVLANTGAFVIFYGGEYGLKIDSAPTTTPRCYGGTTPVCEPTLLYLPNREASEFTYISSSPAGDINGDGIPDVLLGAPGRSHPSGKAFATGVVYVLY